jgi:hypothetical protein
MEEIGPREEIQILTDYEIQQLQTAEAERQAAGLQERHMPLRISVASPPGSLAHSGAWARAAWVEGAWAAEAQAACLQQQALAWSQPHGRWLQWLALPP